MVRIHRTTQAETDLLEIWLYVADDSGKAADKILNTLDEKIRLIADQTKIGRERPDLYPRLRSFPAESYIIYYLSEPDGIVVVRVLHSSRDQEGLFLS